MKILFLTRFGMLGASSRLRLLQYLPSFNNAGIEYVVSPFICDSMLSTKYTTGKYSFWSLVYAYFKRVSCLLRCSKFDVIWIEKEALPWFPTFIETFLLKKKLYVLDYDDAVFHTYDLHKLGLVRLIFGYRIDKLMKNATLVIAGNRYLASRATKAGAKTVQILPTVIDLTRYKVKQLYDNSEVIRIVWIGSPSTVKYILDLSEPLAELARRHKFILRIIGGGNISIPGVDVESLAWSEETESSLIVECDIGVMPLHDTPWEQGKCAYKLIQYMACGLPTVASPVGANCEVLVNEETGLLADTASEWLFNLERLFISPDLRARFGICGRQKAVEQYSLQTTSQTLVSYFLNVK